MVYKDLSNRKTEKKMYYSTETFNKVDHNIMEGKLKNQPQGSILLLMYNALQDAKVLICKQISK